DEPGDVIYIKNETLGSHVSKTQKVSEIQGYIPGLFTAAPIVGCENKEQYICEHGFGYTRFTTVQSGISSCLTVFVHSNERVKISVLEIKNEMTAAAEISIAYFSRLVMGEKPCDNAPYTGTKWDDTGCMLIAENHRKEMHFAKKVFLTGSLVADSYTGNADEFIGKDGSIAYPCGMRDYASYLSDSCGYGFNPCMAVKNRISVKPGNTVSVVYMLGCGDDENSIAEIIQGIKNPYDAQKQLSYVKNLWSDFLGNISVDTPDDAFNFMVNGWLMYQVKSCRVDGKSAFYQSGGAYGFRDQLQDSLAMLHADSEFVRRHILLCASRQYEEGDVQHWWHPPENAGVRTNYSDDLLWLPYAVYHYVEFTGDKDILFEDVPFLKSEELKPSEHDRYEHAEISEKKADIFTHCILAVNRAMHFGAHGLPLMGGGDWNDGMNKVGTNGGESVWLGWFLCTVASYMQTLAEKTGREAEYTSVIKQITNSIETNAWDKDRYMRAFFGDGTPLGASSCAECSIDSLSQSWSVISGMADKKRARTAIETAYANLVDKENGVVRLLSPPFAGNSKNNPGYISDYPPGIRENGAQYTHAAVWLAKAFFEDGQKERGYELLSMLNPVNHSRTEHEANIYKTEPYAVAADVSYGDGNTGRGGWSW
ncbi:MAG: hypothetical protein IJZ76_11345, partial [Lachnospiraceae bacterium]|nr:hypothetical protein [Lachnospiraceae bacterium]